MAKLVAFYSRADENYFGDSMKYIQTGNTEKAAKMIAEITGAGQIGMAIARRMGYGMKIVVGDKKLENAQAVTKILFDAGFDAEPFEIDLSSRDSIRKLIEKAQGYGEISMLVNAAGVSPSQASIETILKVDLYGTAVLLEEVGKVIKKGGVGVTISSQSGWRMPALSAEEARLLATTPTEELLSLPMLQLEHIKDTLHAYQIAKRGARINAIAQKYVCQMSCRTSWNSR